MRSACSKRWLFSRRLHPVDNKMLSYGQRIVTQRRSYAKCWLKLQEKTEGRWLGMAVIAVDCFQISLCCLIFLLSAAV